MTLYEINEQIEQLIENSVDPETGEIDESVIEELDNLSLAKNEKIENVACYIKSLKAEAEALKKEAQSFSNRQKSCEKKVERLKDYLAYCLNGEKFKSIKANIYYSHSQKVECEDLSNVPSEYLRVADPELDKVAVKKALQEGIQIEGCSLVETQSVVIK